MRTDDFDFDLPEDLIAQHPLEKRDQSRLLVLDKQSGILMIYWNICGQAMYWW